jgi:hypothetical protein
MITRALHRVNQIALSLKRALQNEEPGKLSIASAGNFFPLEGSVQVLAERAAPVQHRKTTARQTFRFAVFFMTTPFVPGVLLCARKIYQPGDKITILRKKEEFYGNCRYWAIGV